MCGYCVWIYYGSIRDVFSHPLLCYVCIWLFKFIWTFKTKSKCSVALPSRNISYVEYSSIYFFLWFFFFWQTGPMWPTSCIEFIHIRYHTNLYVFYGCTFFQGVYGLRQERKSKKKKETSDTRWAIVDGSGIHVFIVYRRTRIIYWWWWVNVCYSSSKIQIYIYIYIYE